MINNLKTVTKGSLVYGFGNISIKLVGLILIPFYTNEKHLSVSDFAVMGIIDITSQFLIALVSLSLYQALFRWYWEDGYKDKRKSMFFSVFAFITLVSIISTLIFTLYSSQLSVLLFDSKQYSYALKVMMVSSALQILIMLVQSLMKIQQKPVFFTITNVVKLLVTLLLTILFLVVYKRGIEGIYEAQIFGSVIFLILCSKYLSRNFELTFNYRLIKEMLRYSYPLLLASTTGSLIFILDKYVLNYMVSRSEVSIYVFAYRITNSLKIFVIASVQMAVTPFVFQIMNDRNNKRFYSKYMTYFAFIVMICGIALSIFGYELVRLFAQSEIYYNAWTVIPILMFAFYFSMLKDTATTGLQIKMKTGIISIITVLITILNLGLNYLLVNKLSYYGSSLAFLLSQFLFFVFSYYFAQRVYHVAYEVRKIFLITILGVFICVLPYFINEADLWIRLLVKIVSLISFPILLYPMGFYEEIEITRLKEIWKKWKNPTMWIHNLKKEKMDF